MLRVRRTHALVFRRAAFHSGASEKMRFTREEHLWELVANFPCRRAIN